MMAALWSDVDDDIASSRHHFTMAIDIFDRLARIAPGRDRYMVTAAFMHAMLAGYTSFESGMKRLLLMMEEPLPTGGRSHADLVRRISESQEGLRPAILPELALQRAVQGLMGFRHVAAHAYDLFDEDRAALAARDAETFLAGIGPALARFRAIIDPD